MHTDSQRKRKPRPPPYRRATTQGHTAPNGTVHRSGGGLARSGGHRAAQGASNRGKASTQPTRAPAPAQGHRTRARARAGRIGWHRSGARPAPQPLALGTANSTRARGWVSFVPCMVQSPCTPIRSAKGNPPAPFRRATTQGRTTLQLTQCKFDAVAECPAWPQGKRAPNQEWAFSPSTNW